MGFLFESLLSFRLINSFGLKKKEKAIILKFFNETIVRATNKYFFLIHTPYICEWKIVNQGLSMGRVFVFNFCSFVGFYYINILNTHLTPLSSFLGRGSNRPIAFYQKSKKAICLFRECLRKSRAPLRESYTVTLLTVHFKTSASSISRHYDRFWSSRT